MSIGKHVVLAPIFWYKESAHSAVPQTIADQNTLTHLYGGEGQTPIPPPQKPLEGVPDTGRSRGRGTLTGIL